MLWLCEKAHLPLKHQPQGELNLPRTRSRVRNFSGVAPGFPIAIKKVPGRDAEIRPVEEIEKLRAKLQGGIFSEPGYIGILHYGGVHIGDSGGDGDISAQVAQEERCRETKLGHVEVFIGILWADGILIASGDQVQGTRATYLAHLETAQPRLVCNEVKGIAIVETQDTTQAPSAEEFAGRSSHIPPRKLIHETGIKIVPDVEARKTPFFFAQVSAPIRRAELAASRIG